MKTIALLILLLGAKAHASCYATAGGGMNCDYSGIQNNNSYIQDAPQPIVIQQAPTLPNGYQHSPNDPYYQNSNTGNY